ncbi:site-specific DNA-methyltransferase [Haladaptatus cibarius]|uniref:site-specific DNA-methyltransferase n=1 Tax=Haladaptatus cibarius TaxID=453847 RepID=UPI002277324E|nr:site-specific DNA-methyltransferase [Haladaptatus cibarius]
MYHYSEEQSELKHLKAPSVWDVNDAAIDNQGDYGKHPAPFSTSLVEKALKYTTTEGELILDPFMGSGTTAVAAIQNERNFVGFELDEEGAYKPIIERRIREAKRQMTASVNQTIADDD